METGLENAVNTMTAEQYQSSGAWGLSAMVDLHGCNPEKITSASFILRFIKALCAVIGMQPHGAPLIDQFGGDSLEGYSALQFIETSSITIHFDDKTGNRAFVDIFSCKFFDVNVAAQFCMCELQGDLINVSSQLRL